MLYNMLVATTAQYPKKNAIELENSNISYELLLKKTNCFAENLASLGVKSNDSVMLILPNGIEFVVAVFAIAKLGAIIIPLNIALESTELDFYLNDSKPKILVSTTKLISQHSDLFLKHLKNNQIITDSHLSQWENIDEITVSCNVSSEAIALYQYSSGSTGKPKRVMRTQANLIHEANNYKATVAVTPESRILCVVPMFHSYGFGNCLLASICSGATLFILHSFNRDAVMTVLKTKGITIFPGLPFIFSILADSNSITKVELTDLKLAFTAGAPLSQKIFEGFKNKFGVPLRQLYGSTETGSISINLGKTDDGLWESVGKPMHGVTVMIMSEEGQLLPPCNIGEVVVHSAAMTHGYAGSVEVNREAFRDGYFWSGDLGKLDSDGNLFITGRKKQFINVGANKVDPKEIEELLNTHPSIQESVVLGIPGLYGDEIVKAVLVLNEKLDAEIVKDWLRGKIADFKIPRVIEFRQEIPRSPLGKILRKHLQG
jgi:long-chain acyl-CoA synthetase